MNVRYGSNADIRQCPPFSNASAFAPELPRRYLVAALVLVWLLKLLGPEPGYEPEKRDE